MARCADARPAPPDQGATWAPSAGSGTDRLPWAALAVARGGVATPAPGAGGPLPADTNVYLVWSMQPGGVETVWLVPDGDGSTVEATRRQAMIFQGFSG